MIATRVWLLSLLVCMAGWATTGWVGHAQETKKPEDLTALLEPIRKEHGPPALGAAVIRGDDLIAIGATGLRRVNGKEKVTIDDRWHLGSCTKALTATLIARLVEAKKMSFDTTLEKAFPKVKLHADFKPVTLDQLMRNRGGAPPDLNANGLWAKLWQRQGTERAQRMQVVNGVLTKAPHVKPGTKYVYSNGGFSIVGAAAETRMKASWESLITKHVFRPLGMRNSGFGPPGLGDKKVRQPWGHRAAGATLTPMKPGPAADNPPGIGPAAIAHCTLGDWARFAGAHLRGARGEKTGFLTPATFKHLHTPKKGQSYALGWGVSQVPQAGGTVLAHDGSNTMWYARVKILPTRNIAVLVTCNAADPGAQKAVAAASNALLIKFASK